ncbi:hypothetical protein GIB67_026625 [Kingdonia uniflora]|uniref:Glycosyltransferases n=1 Tax=Kingdonia uniflora TaxID=39325 RepID=A0A7J7NI44_9MAGN|nr:hypothetical protein GIB67_026625 [Kingdonia uniflora]
MYRHLTKIFMNVKDRGVHQRNTVLEHIGRHKLDGIVYFVEDDNIYSLELFESLLEIRLPWAIFRFIFAIVGFAALDNYHRNLFSHQIIAPSLALSAATCSSLLSRMNRGYEEYASISMVPPHSRRRLDSTGISWFVDDNTKIGKHYNARTNQSLQ